MRLLRLLMVLACLGLGAVIAALNGDPVVLDLLWTEWRVPLGLLLLLVLLLGALLGGLALLLSRWTQALWPRRTSAPAETSGGDGSLQ